MARFGWGVFALVLAASLIGLPAAAQEPASAVAPVVSVGDVAIVEGASRSDTRLAVVPVTLTLPAAAPVTVRWSAEAGTAGPSDFQAGSGGATIPAGRYSANIEVVIYGDDVAEDPETALVTISGTEGVVVGRGSGPVTILDASASGLSVGDVTVVESDDPLGYATAVVSVVVPEAAGADLPFSFETVALPSWPAGGATVDRDFRPVGGDGVIPAGRRQARVQVLVRGDALVEGPETLSVQIEAAEGVAVARPSGTITILDQDAPVDFRRRLVPSSPTATPTTSPRLSPDGRWLENSWGFVTDLTTGMAQRIDPGCPTPSGCLDRTRAGADSASWWVRTTSSYAPDDPAGTPDWYRFDLNTKTLTLLAGAGGLSSLSADGRFGLRVRTDRVTYEVYVERVEVATGAVDAAPGDWRGSPTANLSADGSTVVITEYEGCGHDCDRVASSFRWRVGEAEAETVGARGYNVISLSDDGGVVLTKNGIVFEDGSFRPFSVRPAIDGASVDVGSSLSPDGRTIVSHAIEERDGRTVERLIATDTTTGQGWTLAYGEGAPAYAYGAPAMAGGRIVTPWRLDATFVGDHDGSLDLIEFSGVLQPDGALLRGLGLQPVPTLVKEGDEGLVGLVPVVIPQPQPVPVTFDWSIVARPSHTTNATLGADVVARSGSTTIPAGFDTAHIPVWVLGDQMREYDERFTIRIDRADVPIARSEVPVTIHDDDTPMPRRAAGVRALDHDGSIGLGYDAHGRPAVVDVASGNTTALILGLGGGAPNNSVILSDLSADGSVAVLESSASNLVAGDTNGVSDVFMHVIATGETRRVSVDRSGAQADRASQAARISADGSAVVFESAATNLVDHDTNLAIDAFHHDLASGVTTRVSVRPFGAQARFGGRRPTVDATGRIVTFDSISDAVDADTDNRPDVFVRLLDEPTTLVAPGLPPLNPDSPEDVAIDAEVTADGTTVFFVWSWGPMSDGGEGTVVRWTIGSESVDVVAEDGYIFPRSLRPSSDGATVVWDSLGRFDFDDPNPATGVFDENCWPNCGWRDVHLADLATGHVRLVSRRPPGAAGGSSSGIDLSGDGRTVVLTSNYSFDDTPGPGTWLSGPWR